VPLRAAWLHVIIINMDTERRNKLVEKLKGQDPMPLVSLEEFFIGNDDEASIGCNLMRRPGMNVFYETLKEIRSKPNVQDVLVEIADLMLVFYQVDESARIGEAVVWLPHHLQIRALG
jgi:hypothetical protein